MLILSFSAAVLEDLEQDTKLDKIPNINMQNKNR
jgi:hypothetical protein